MISTIGASPPLYYSIDVSRERLRLAQGNVKEHSTNKNDGGKAHIQRLRRNIETEIKAHKEERSTELSLSIPPIRQTEQTDDRYENNVWMHNPFSHRWSKQFLNRGRLHP